MRKDFGARALSCMQPVYIIATYNEDGTADLMNAAWGGISNDTELSICLSADHRTVENFKRTGAFTVSMGDAGHVTACDYVGIVSGKTEPDKLGKSGFTVSRSALVNAPVVNELSVCIECTVKLWDEEHERLVGQIVNVSVDECALTDGRVDLSKVQPISFDPFNHAYHVLGEKVGNAFKDGQKLK